MYAPPPMPAAPLSPQPAPRGRHSNWGLRLLAALLSALAFAGFWLGAQHAPPRQYDIGQQPVCPAN